MLNIAVFGSGTGSNFRSILAAIDHGTLTGATIRLVVSNKAEAGILAIARAHALPSLHLSQNQFPDEESFAAAMLSALRGRGVDFIALAGYLKRVPSSVVAAFRNRIVNIHPALLPRFGGPGMYGHHVHAAVLAAGEKVSGASVHYVDEEYDRGPVILQKTVPVLPGDTPESLAARILAVEHELYPEALRMIAAREGKGNAAHT